MATIQRNVKTFGTRSFVDEVAAAPSNLAPILSNEVDADLDTVYAAWNGGADTVNIKDGAVTSAKILASNVRGSPSAGGTAREIAKASIWAGDDLIDLSIPTGKLANGAVTTAKIAANSTRRTSVGAAIPANQVITGPVAGTVLLTLPSLSTGGGIVWLVGSIGCRIACSTGSSSVAFILRRGGTDILTLQYTVSASNVGMPVPTPFTIDAPAAGSYVYSLAVSVAANGTFVTDPNYPGSFNAYEFA